MKQVAFFGLGAMGEPMAQQLLEAGYEVCTSVHRSREAADRLAPAGLKLCASPAEAAAASDILISILPADPEVLAFWLDPAMTEAVKPGSVIVDMSSCTTEAICKVEEHYRARQVGVVDAPVSGGVHGAKAGKLTIFGSGSEADLAAVDPLFQVMGETVYNLGKCGAGKAFKNLNNLLYLINLAAVAEGYHIAKENGIDLATLQEVISKSSGASAALSAMTRMDSREYQPAGFKHGLARKDVGNAIKLAAKTPTPLSHLVYDLMLGNAKYDEDSVLAVREMLALD